MKKVRKPNGPRPTIGIVLGLCVFERISAGAGIRLTAEMRRDLLAFERDRIGMQERTRFIAEKYGREPFC